MLPRPKKKLKTKVVKKFELQSPERSEEDVEEWSSFGETK